MCAMRRNGSTTKSFSSKEALVKCVALTYGRSWADELTSWLTSSQSSSSSCFFSSSYFYSTTVLLQTASSSSSVICCSSSFYSTFCFFSSYRTPQPSSSKQPLRPHSLSVAPPPRPTPSSQGKRLVRKPNSWQNYSHQWLYPQLCHLI